jgi:hypothetical protein
MVFVGGSDYAEIQSDLWRFAVIGTLLAMLQLLVYSVLARQGRGSAYLVWVAVAALVGIGATLDTLEQLVTTVTVIDAALFVTLLTLSLIRTRERAPEPDVAPPPVQ